MAIHLRCKCGKQLSAPDDSVGKKGKCPHCQTLFTVPSPVQKPIQPSNTGSEFGLSDLNTTNNDLGSLLDEDLTTGKTISQSGSSAPADTFDPFGPPKKSKRAAATSGKANMGLAGTGIKLVYWGTLCSLIASLLFVIIIFITGMKAANPGGRPVLFQPGLAPPPGLALIIGGLILTAFLGGLAAFVGRFLCLGVPSAVGANTLIYGAIACDLFCFLFGIVNQTAKLPPALGIIVLIAALGSNILFLQFLRKISEYLGQSSLAERAGKALQLFGVTIGLYITGLILVFVIGPFAALLILAALVTGIMGFYQYLKTLQGLAKIL